MKHWRILTLVGAFVLLAGLAVVWRGQTVAGGRTAMEVVRRALAAEEKLSYTGRKVSHFPMNGKLVESEAMVARRPPNLRRYHYVTPPLAGVTVWKNQNLTYRHDPRTKTLEIYDRSNQQEKDEEKRTLVLKNYEPQLEGEETVAGRTAYRIRLAPRHAGDAWRRWWIDKETYLRLRTEDFDGKDRLIRRSRFEEVSFNDLGEEAFQPPQSLLATARKTYSDEEQPKSVAYVSSVLGFRIKLPTYVPGGYRLKGAYTYPCECGCAKAAAQVRWTNGLNTISMFQCGHPCGQEAACTFPTGPQSASVPVAVGEESFLFVGETDRANLVKMAESLKAAAQ